MSDTDTREKAPRRAGGVQSLERAFGILETMADAGGTLGLSELATRANLPLPTIHRFVRTLVDLGYLRQEPSRQYALGSKLIWLGESSAHMLGTWARPYLSDLVDSLGESANLAMLDGDQIVYLGQVQSRQSMRMFTEVGRRVSPHCTAVGKALLALIDPADVQALLSRTGMQAPPSTPSPTRRCWPLSWSRCWSVDMPWTRESRSWECAVSPLRCPGPRHASLCRSRGRPLG
jgi:Transcriptional regulator